ncbi:MAG: hypothetical protein L0332_03085 [Chloroflexi bacterium]|nr:hypothetical protein [Chloroflexota bacterium]MCI0645839.1 hypothetical protein [Chloroflexota bacterium]MCI0725694.1 hypothetical protein [Chloroflexota bacterium]
MELIDRYVQEVGQNLPANLRKDVETELRSLLEDTVEDRAARAGQKENEELVVAVLEEFGPPEKVAASYAPPNQYLIGPKLYPVFTRIVAIITVLLVILFALNLARTLPGVPIGELPATVLDSVSTFLDSAFMLLGVAVFVFAILERIEPKGATAARRWDPRKLPPVDDPDRVRAGWLAGEAVIISVLLILLNLFPQWVGAIIVTDEGSRFLPVLATEFETHLPWLNIWLGLNLLLNLWLLRDGRWRRASRWLDLGLSLLGMFVLYRLITGAPVIGITPDWAALHGWPAIPLARIQQNVIPILSIVVDVALALGLLISVAASGLKLYRLFKKKTAPIIVQESS